MTVGEFRVWPFGHQAPAHARQPVVQVGFCPFGAEMMVVRRIPSRMRCNNQGGHRSISPNPVCWKERLIILFTATFCTTYLGRKSLLNI